MTGRKSTPKVPVRDTARARGSRGNAREGVVFPVPPPRTTLPHDYAETLREIKQRIQRERLRVVLDRQERAGWGAKVIDRLSADLRDAHPEMQGLSPRNLKYMRAFAAAWPDREIVQRVVAQLPWRQNIALLERLDDEMSLYLSAVDGVLQNRRKAPGEPQRHSRIAGHAAFPPENVVIRADADLTQTALATRIHAKQKSISRYETGKSVPKVETLVKLAKVLRKPAAHFLDDLA